MFVGRHVELKRLLDVASRAARGSPHVVFVSGQAGAGKTELINEFAARVRAVQPPMMAAIGRCDEMIGGNFAVPSSLPLQAFAMIGDQLTGRDRQQADTLGTASLRQRRFLRHTLRAVTNLSPELMGVLFPPAGVIGAIGRHIADEKGWLDGLRDDGGQPSQLARRPEDSEVISRRFASVLEDVSTELPLVLVVDDLHWAGLDTLNLFAHLAR